MLSVEDNEKITRVGPGTPMGELMRRYWQPVLLDWELPEPDCAPLRVRILGEDLVAFRDTSGRVGLIEEWCAHRRTSLFLGRNEEHGLRCVFHGWKYDVNGQCVDMPNELPQYDFKRKVRITAYPTVEMGGVIWAYLGPKAHQPPPPRFEWTQAPESHRYASRGIQDCNWLQALEGGIDSVHSSFLHRRFGGNRAGLEGLRARATAAQLEVDQKSYGYCYASIRPLPEDDSNYVRTYHYVLPHHQLRAVQEQTDVGTTTKFKIAGHVWVPIDDEHTMAWNWYFSLDKPLDESERNEEFMGNGPRFFDYAKGFKSLYTRENDWGIDRQVQKTETFTGIEGINLQDRAAQESMGPIVDRSKERLGQTDRAVITTRRLLLQAIRTIEDGGAAPGSDTSYYDIRAIEKVLPKDARWQDALYDQIYPAGAPV